MTDTKYPIIEKVFSDSVIITAIASIIPLAYLWHLLQAEEFRISELVIGVSQGVLVGMATVVALLSYRYTVRSNIRGAINELNPV